MDIKIYKTSEELAEKLSDYIIDHFILKHKNIAISGGSTPIELFKSISQKLGKSKRIEANFYWIDERCVSPNSEESNFKLANEYLFKNINIHHNNINRIIGENDPKVEVKRYSDLLTKNLDSINNLPSLDLSILGIGNDGHTASIFPYQREKFQNINQCLLAKHPISKQKRVTLSQNLINNSKEIIFQVTGNVKSTVVDEIINEIGNHKSYPASYINPTSGKLSWYLDFHSAKKLTK